MKKISKTYLKEYNFDVIIVLYLLYSDIRSYLFLTVNLLRLMNRINNQLMPGGMYYVSCNGEDNNPFFDLREDYIQFLKEHQKILQPYSDTFAYCLTPSQIFLLVRFKDSTTLVKTHRAFKTMTAEDIAIKNLDSLKRILPSKSIKFLSITEVDSTESNKDFVHLIHAKPVSEGFIRTMSRWEFSSYRAYITGKNDTINREEGLNWFGGTEEFLHFHRTQKL